MELHQILRSGFSLLVFLWAASSSHQIYTVKAILLGNESDHLALLAFKDQITHDHLGALSSWNDTVHFCKWEGITCSKKHQQRVTALELRSWGLGGSLPPSIGNLTFLQKLILDNNNFNNKIPPELGRLRRLKYLNLSGNSFQGAFPMNLTHCSKLRTLSLFSNQLVGNVPVEIDSLSTLNVLYLGNNSFTGVIPSSIGNLSLLLGFSVTLNHLTGSIPEDVSRLTMLVLFEVSANNFTGTIPSQLFNISSLHYLIASVNTLHGQLPPNMGISLPNLRLIFLGDNQFYGPIPASLTNASGLQNIDIGQNNFSGKVPSDLGRLPQLYYLNMEENQLKARDVDDWKFMDSLANCSNLQLLALYGNKLEGILPNSLVNLSSQIQTLAMGANQISGNIPHGIENLANLNQLTLEDNLLIGSIPESIGKLARLELFGLSGNKLTGQIPSSVGNLTYMKRLFLFNNYLEGSIPRSLGNLQHLFLLDLSHNHLTGTIPKEIISLSSLSVYLDLSDNSLVGSLPQEIGALKNLGSLHVSRNMLSGNIPSTLGNCEILEILEMNNNLFQGIIPQALSNIKGLQQLDLSYNNLTGSIPAFLEDLNLLEYLNLSFNQLEGEVPIRGVFKNATQVTINGNDKLCGGIPELHLPACQVTPSRKRRQHLMLKVVISIGSSVLCLVLLFSIVIFQKKQSLRKNAGTAPPLEDQFPRVSYTELVRATDGFSSTNLIGKGGYGSVYKGVLGACQTIVAVKVFNLQNQGASKSFIAECEALRSIRHRNLVKILTSCSLVDFRGNDFKALIFEFIPNGSLEKWLHPESDGHNHSESLSLLQRLNIAIDVAIAMDYLHNDCQPPIIHCDLKPSNVLLDNELVAHVGDFGLARFISKATESSSTGMSSSVRIRGSIGYIAPEYGAGGKASRFGDVYSYGILLLEMLTGKSPINNMFKDGLSLQKFVEMAFPNKVIEIVDPLMPLVEDRSKGHECLVSMARIGLCCSNQSARERMNISDVATKMHAIRDTYLGARNY
ncbi:receptor kinase-like protein Xa21 [Elaeis guineensis]|uniref:Receptor kinase-like protein Xa21 n=1 Tax=Elaeis guineensis var. tenera TaxID=51953 RepID=A0A6I9S829_ELAGV|nr:probable LRR receptor-like serine/threonine-protein kinase At3g47570 [Elaeis guineensis]